MFHLGAALLQNLAVYPDLTLRPVAYCGAVAYIGGKRSGLRCSVSKPRMAMACRRS